MFGLSYKSKQWGGMSQKIVLNKHVVSFEVLKCKHVYVYTSLQQSNQFRWHSRIYCNKK